jgi:hypothetical protein
MYFVNPKSYREAFKQRDLDLTVPDDSAKEGSPPATAGALPIPDMSRDLYPCKEVWLVSIVSG